MPTTFHVPLDERAILLRHGVPVAALEPGRHRYWGAGYTVTRFKLAELVFDAPAELRGLLPVGWYGEASLGPRQRGVLSRNGRPVRYLRPGIHRFWTVDPSVELRVLDVDQPVPELTDELRAVIPAGELVEVTVLQHQRGLKYVAGRFAEQLGPGRYLFWSHPEARVAVTLLDTRLQQVNVPGQDLMTRDKVTLRLTLTVEYAPTDLPVSVHAVADVRDALYLEVQLAARDFVAGVTLDELLEGRDAMTRALEAQVVPRAQALGVAVHRVGVKDVVLPGEMKTLLNRVIEAEKAAAANVILRREEASAMRSMANTARVIADHPLLLDLKRLETLEKVAEHVDEVRLVVGKDGWAGLLADKPST
ncbi:MAG: slipin family protein [Kofleriaceae bacterium]|nr:slipin family protein [Myxococcales bacterium]MCB9561855.1 slipin family protein [Kofleriaceae bacterium]